MFSISLTMFLVCSSRVSPFLHFQFFFFNSFLLQQTLSAHTLSKAGHCQTVSLTVTHHFTVYETNLVSSLISHGFEIHC